MKLGIIIFLLSLIGSSNTIYPMFYRTSRMSLASTFVVSRFIKRPYSCEKPVKPAPLQHAQQATKQAKESYQALLEEKDRWRLRMHECAEHGCRYTCVSDCKSSYEQCSRGADFLRERWQKCEQQENSLAQFMRRTPNRGGRI